MPRRYLELEEQRLTKLVTEWLDYEATRIAFEVADTEVKRTVHIAGLTLDLRLDRIDRLNDGSLLVIDYKSGDVSPNSWELPRPDDVQLPLYAGFAARPRAMKCSAGWSSPRCAPEIRILPGRSGEPAATLFASLKGTSSLVKNQLTVEQLIEWRDLHRAASQRFSRRTRRSRPARVPQDLRALRPANALPHSGASRSRWKKRTSPESEEAGDE